MLLRILLFEIKYRLTRPATWLYFILFFLLAFFATTSDFVRIGGGTSNLLKNSPYVITLMMVTLTSIGILVSSAIMANPVYRDVEHRTEHFLYAYPITKGQYLFGRFLGSWLIAILVFGSIPLGVFLGSILGPALGWIPAEQFGANHWEYYLQPWLAIGAVNILVAGSIFFSLVTISRRIVLAYTGNILLLVCYLIGAELMSELPNKELVALLDPLGLNLLEISTKYWTVAEQNTHTVALEGLVLSNRLIWLSISFGLLLLTYFKFDFNRTGTSGKKKAKKEDTTAPISTNYRPVATAPLSNWEWFKLMLQSTKVYVLETIRDVPFIGIVFSGLVLVVMDLSNLGSLYETKLLPKTYVVVESLMGSFGLFMQIFIVFYTGELVWKERRQLISLIYDSLPAPDWFQPLAKLLSMGLLILLLQTCLMVMGIFTQLFHGFFEIDLGQYFFSFYVLQFSGLMMWAAIALLIQSVVKDKFTGFFLVAVVYISKLAFGLGEISHPLYNFFTYPGIEYSEINGYGHFIGDTLPFRTYWLAFSALMIVLMVLFYSRGIETGTKDRWKKARQRFSGGNRLAFFLMLAIMVGSGSWIYYNLHIVNDFMYPKEMEKLQVKVERQWKHWEKKPQPHYAAIDLDVAIYPEERRVTTQANIWLKNPHAQPIDSILFILPDDKMKMEIKIQGGELVKKHDEGLWVYALKNPLQPGDSIPATMSSERKPHGFTESGSNSPIVYNGSFFNNSDLLPAIGYSGNFELQDKAKRKKYGLPPKPRAADVDDTAALRINGIGPDAAFIRFACTVSTSADQSAIAPGYLEKEWTSPGRRHFRYVMDAPIQNFYAILSGRYEKKLAQANGISYEIWYQKGHEYNLDRMMKGLKDAVQYCAAAFSPFQYRQMRIIEFPRYATFAQSFPNTVPFSESLGFIADISKPGKIDYVYYVTAHEVAHQWWGHQIAGASAQGNEMLIESLAQYSALMVMEKQFGRDQMQKFLKYELDSYLTGRKTDVDKEQPLFRCENQQYIHYNKGSLVFYALKDYLGEKQLNAILSEYVKKHAFQGPPFAGSREFVNLFLAGVPDSSRYLIHDLLENITLYSLKTKTANVTSLGNNRYRVSLEVEAEKFRADSLGNEKSMKLDEWMDIGVKAAEQEGGKSKYLYLAKHKIRGGKQRIEVVVEGKPEQAGVDPLNILIDREPDDNLIAVTMKK